MIVKIKENPIHPNSYDLFVYGKLHIYAESMTVVDNVKTALIGGYYQPLKHSEADELAAAIRKEYKQ